MMAQFDPTSREHLSHGGTFNTNIITMVAGLAGMKLYDEDAANHLNEFGERLRTGVDGAFEKAGMAGQATSLGSLAPAVWQKGRLVDSKRISRRAQSLMCLH